MKRKALAEIVVVLFIQIYFLSHDINPIMLYVINLGTAIWVLVDAKNIGVKKGLVSGFGNMGPWAWFFAVLLLWPVIAIYLYYRGKYKLAFATTSVPVNSLPTNERGDQSEGWAIKNIERLASLREGIYNR